MSKSTKFAAIYKKVADKKNFDACPVINWYNHIGQCFKIITANNTAQLVMKVDDKFVPFYLPFKCFHPKRHMRVFTLIMVIIFVTCEIPVIYIRFVCCYLT